MNRPRLRASSASESGHQRRTTKGPGRVARGPHGAGGSREGAGRGMRVPELHWDVTSAQVLVGGYDSGRGGPLSRQQPQVPELQARGSGGACHAPPSGKVAKRPHSGPQPREPRQGRPLLASSSQGPASSPASESRGLRERTRRMAPALRSLGKHLNPLTIASTTA